MTKLKLHWQILIALVLAGILGTATGTDAALFGVTFYSVFGFLGTLFLNALKMLIVPLIASSIIVGVAGIGSGGMYAAAAAKALLKHTNLSAREIVEQSLHVAGEICVYSNQNITVETIG